MIHKHAKGFTIFEILIVVTILGTLMIGLVPMVMRRAASANKKATLLTMKTIKQSIDLFHADTGTYPETLKDLVKKPDDEEIGANWNQYMDSVPKDAWNSDFKYEATPDGDNPYELYSYGPDGKKGKPGDRINVWKIK